MAEINLTALNTLARDNPDRMIRSSEESYHDKILSVAERVTKNENIKVILLAGPSGSGKTTTANLIADKIRQLGEHATVVSLDNFFLDQADSRYPKTEHGAHDYESPEALNLHEIHLTLERVIGNKPFEIPRYDFKSAGRVGVEKHAPVGHGCVIVEGIHALNPKIADSLPAGSILRLFVSVSTNINDAGKRIISGRKLRFVRRLVRDSIYRGADAYRTLNMWQGVLAAEDIHLYPYKSTADLTFDTFHDFEPCVMKHFAERVIPRELAEKDPYVAEVASALSKFVEIDHTKIPENSLIREFIPGGIYEELY